MIKQTVALCQTKQSLVNNKLVIIQKPRPSAKFYYSYFLYKK